MDAADGLPTVRVCVDELMDRRLLKCCFDVVFDVDEVWKPTDWRWRNWMNRTWLFPSSYDFADDLKTDKKQRHSDPVGSLRRNVVRFQLSPRLQ
jgi:hypothetical protein